MIETLYTHNGNVVSSKPAFMDSSEFIVDGKWNYELLSHIQYSYVLNI